MAIIAGLLGFVSVVLPWFSINLWTQDLNITMEFTAFLYQLTGTVEGVTKSIFLLVWFNACPLVLMLTSGTICVVAGVFASKKRVLLLTASFLLALISVTVFAYGLLSSSFAVERLNPGYTISQFPQGSFGLTAEQSMQHSYHYSWSIGYGFWLALVSAAFALFSALMTKRIS